MLVNCFKGTVAELRLALKISQLTGIPLWRFSR
jgi:hypothetical protein